MDAETKKLLEEANKTLHDLRQEAEKKSVDVAKVEKMQARLDELEQVNTKITAEHAEEKKASAAAFTAQEEKILGLEKKLYRLPNNAPALLKDSAEVKGAFNALKDLARKGKNFNVNDPEYKGILTVGDDVSAGYLTGTEFADFIAEEVYETSPLRQLASVYTTSMSNFEIPTEDTLVIAGFAEEIEEAIDGSNKYGMVELRPERLSAVLRLSGSLRADKRFNLEGILQKKMTQAMAKVEGAKFINGTGMKEPSGFLNNSDVQIVNSTVSADFAVEDLFTMQGELQTGYNGSWLLNRRTLAKLRTKKGSDGQFLYAPAAAGLPATIAGDPYALAIDMPNVGALAKSIAYGDWSRGYAIVDKDVVSVKVDDTTEATKDVVRLIFHRYVDGKVVKPAAIKVLRCLS